MYTPKLLSHGHVELKRERTLPISGTAHVSIGDVVSGDEIVLSTELKGDLTIIRILDKLGITSEEAQKGILVKEGEAIVIGTTLFKKKGLFGYFEETVVSPVQGIVEFIIEESAHIGIRSAPEILQIQAYIPGTIESISANRQVAICSKAGIIQGVFGLGRERSGLLRVLPVEAETIVSVSHIENLGQNEVENSIIAGGSSITQEAFDLLHQWKAIGIVTASLKSEFVKEILSKHSYHEQHTSPSILITEGFGHLKMSEHTKELLQKNHNQKASISGKTQIRAGAIRPEIIFHSPDLDIPCVKEEVTSDPSPGDMVRIVRGAHFGKNATIIELPPVPFKLDSGVEARVVEVLLEGNQKTTVALANIETR